MEASIVFVLEQIVTSSEVKLKKKKVRNVNYHNHFKDLSWEG